MIKTYPHKSFHANTAKRSSTGKQERKANVPLRAGGWLASESVRRTFSTLAHRAI